MYLHILCEILFLSQQLQTWQQCKTFLVMSNKSKTGSVQNNKFLKKSNTIIFSFMCVSVFLCICV
jgi:hypothetical protein